MKKVLVFALVLTLIVGCLAGCGSKQTSGKGEKVVIEVGGWPLETETEKRASYDKLREDFMKENPDIEIVPVEWHYDVKAYLTQATSGQVPTLYDIYFTEVDRVINAGFARDITEAAKKFGWYDAYDDGIKDLVFRDGKLYLLPVGCYSMGLQINKRVFEKAGLVNDDGTVMIPETYDEVVEFSKIIKEKTGAYGFMMNARGNGGGWHFLNLAWSYGTEFMKQVDGKWKATFDSDECVAALQYLSDLKWKYDLLPADALMPAADISQLFASDKLGMTYAEPSGSSIIKTYNFPKEDLVYASMPEGPGGRFTQMGGTISCIDRNATDEQVEACFKWLEFMGKGPKLTDNAKKSIVEKYDVALAENNLVGIAPMSVWKEGTEIRDFTTETVKEKANVDVRNFAHYEEGKATLKPEEPVNCQELYQVLASCMQAVLTDKNANIEEVVKKAASDFQSNSLNNAK